MSWEGLYGDLGGLKDGEIRKMVRLEMLKGLDNNTVRNGYIIHKNDMMT